MADLDQKLEAAITKIDTDSGKFHTIVHGGADETVATDSGDVKTAANAIATLIASAAAEIAEKIDELGDLSAYALKDFSNAPANALYELGLKGYRGDGTLETLAHGRDLDGIDSNSAYAFVGADDNILNSPEDIGAGVVVTFYNDILRLFGMQIVYKISSELHGRANPIQFTRTRIEGVWGEWIKGSGGGSSDRFRVIGLPDTRYGYASDGGGFILSDGTIRIWGTDENDQLGINSYTGTDIKKPIQPAFPRLTSAIKKWVRVWQSSIVLLEDGTVWVWGGNSVGQLGQNDFYDVHHPTKVNLNFDSLVKDISMGDTSADEEASHTFILTANGQLWATGRNDAGQLGVGRGDLNRFNTVAGRTYRNIYAFGGSHGYSYAIATNGDLYVCGYNVSGQLGIGTTLIENSRFVKAELGGKVAVDIASNGLASGADENHYTLMLTEDNLVYGVGTRTIRNQDGVDEVSTSVAFADRVIPGAGDITKMIVAIDVQIVLKGGNVYFSGYLGLILYDTFFLLRGSDIVDMVATSSFKPDIYVLLAGGNVEKISTNTGVHTSLDGFLRHRPTKLIVLADDTIGALTDDGYYYQMGSNQPDNGVYPSFQIITP